MVCLALLLTGTVLAGTAGAGQDFEAWLSALREEARAEKISDEILDAALKDVQPLEDVIELDRHQPESTLTFSRYLDRVVSERRIDDGRRMMRQHRDLLESIRERYGVQPRFLVALWGVESRYGERMGDHRVVEALVTLAYDGRRGEFFRRELINALHILEERHVEPDRMLGSWAGAMGQMQFMPSTFRNYSVDFDGDSRSDLWGNTPDALASAANYLARSGWRGDQTWGRPVRLPDGFDPALVGSSAKRTIPRWAELGVRRADGGELPRRALPAFLVQPGGASGPTYMVYDNYRTLLRWNRSDYFAVSVGLLSDALR
jgi:membrane-bound lytic murein transglycosylase B